MHNVYESILNDETYNIIGACMEVHRELGCGFLEAVYQEALAKEFLRRKIPFKKENKITLFYKGDVLEKYYYADFVCYKEIVLELKALSTLESTHEAQVLNYLKASNLYIGLLINFESSSLQQKRLLNKYYRKSI